MFVRELVKRSKEEHWKKYPRLLKEHVNVYVCVLNSSQLKMKCWSQS